jgi:hypothetical protein
MSPHASIPLAQSRTRTGTSGGVTYGLPRSGQSTGQWASPGTVVSFPGFQPSARAFGRPPLRDGPMAGRDSGGSLGCAGIPSRRRPWARSVDDPVVTLGSLAGTERIAGERGPSRRPGPGDDNAYDNPAQQAQCGPGWSDCVLPSQGVAVIIVSEPSAGVTRRVLTERSVPVRSRSSAAHNDTLRYSDARPISVHTKVLAAALSPQTSRVRFSLCTGLRNHAFLIFGSSFALVRHS